MTRNEMQRLLGGDSTVGGGTTDVLTEALKAVADGAGTSSTQELSRLATELEQLRSVNQSQMDAISENTKAVAQNTVAQVSPSGSSTLSKVGSAALTVLGTGLGITPLLSGLVHLLGGGGSEPLPSLATYVRPEPVRVEAGVQGGEYYPVSYGQDGLPRTVPDASAKASPQITVQVQAMDSRSFLDHMDEIASAVKEAMLHSHSLNDVVNDL